VLSNKNSFKRDNSNIIKNNKLNSDSIFRTLSFFAYHNDSKKFEQYFETFKDSFNIEKTDNKNNTLLTLSVKFHSYEIFQFLIEKGANINTQNIYLNTPLHYAFASKLYKYIDLLISKGANENLKNIYGQTCFECIKVESE
jgi:ankyrin repeat protein